MLGKMTLTEIANALAVDYHGPDMDILAISTDSRHITSGSLFVALVGDNFDGHHYIEQALERGAVMAVCQRSGYCPYDSCFVVADTVAAYGKIAALNRGKFAGTLIALTGSAGKTTTKSMLHSVLSMHGSTHASLANENNEIGVAKNLLGLDETHEYAIIEMGARKSGDISWLCQIAQPDIGVVINVSEVHLETFGDINDVARAKSEMFGSMKNNAIAVTNADDRFCRAMIKETKAQGYLFSLDNSQSHSYLTNIQLMPDYADFDLHLSLPNMAESRKVSMSVTGRHNLYNASVTALAAALAGCSMDIIVSGLTAFRSVVGRQSLTIIDDKTSILDDSYNANPASLAVAIDRVTLAGDSMSILVLGDMAELGAESDRLHQQAGEYAASQGVVMLFTLGRKAALAAQAFRQLRPGMAFSFDSHKDLARQLREIINLSTHKILMLVKGSRSMTMEQVIHELKGDG